MGTMKDRLPVLARPHMAFIGVLSALFCLAIPIQIPMAHTFIGVAGIAVCVCALFFVGRHTDQRTAKIERANMVMFAILFSLLTFN